jgi:hypothetical protein
MKSKHRDILASFFMDEDHKLWLNSMSVLGPPEVGYDGKEYRGLSHYDVDWCKTYGYYIFHMSGGGGDIPQSVDGLYWRTEGFRVKEKATKLCQPAEGGGIDKAATKYIRLRNRTRRLNSLPKDLRGESDLLAFLECHGVQDESVYCSVCQDDLPGDGHCEHVWWCDHVGWWSTPEERTTYGPEEIADCECKDCRKQNSAAGLARWCAGEDVDAHFGEVRLRILNGRVEANTDGYRTVEFARYMMPWILEHRGERLVHMGLKLSPEGVSPGYCTLIPWPEIDRLAALLEGGPIDGTL